MKPINELFIFKDTDLYEYHDRLWYEYFHPLKPHSKADAKFILAQLNKVGEAINKEAKRHEHGVVIVTPSTKHEWDDLGPNIRTPIYCEVRMPEPAKTYTKVRTGKIGLANPKKQVDGPVFTDDDEEDLMGDIKATPKGKEVLKKIIKSRSSDPNKVTATSIYPELAKLADKLGDSADKIQKAKPDWPRKCITDALWKWRKQKGGKA